MKFNNIFYPIVVGVFLLDALLDRTLLDKQIHVATAIVWWLIYQTTNYRAELRENKKNEPST